MFTNILNNLELDVQCSPMIAVRLCTHLVFLCVIEIMYLQLSERYRQE